VTTRLVVEADGGSRGNPGPAGYGAVVRDARTGAVLAELSVSLGTCTNNVAEYSGLIAGLREAARRSPGADTEVRMDSKLVVEQMSGRWQIKHPGLRPLAAQAQQAARALGRVTYTWVPRERNTRADRLANEAMDAAAQPPPERTPQASRRAAAQERGGTVTPRSRPSGRLTGGDAVPAGWGSGTPVTTLLLRHGETPLSPERRFAGRGDIPLAETGLAQARAAAARLADRGDVAAVVTSPLRRARLTAEAVAQATGAPWTVDATWAEADFGSWEGLTLSEAVQRWPDEVAAWRTSTAVAPPGGESIETVAERVLAGLGPLMAAHAGQTVVIVSHVTPIKILLVHALAAPLASVRRTWLDVGALCETAWYPDGTAMVRTMNDTTHLRARPPEPANPAHMPLWDRT
jgi:broad specificity phosphatase PhoE/ribonuclease HI